MATVQNSPRQLAWNVAPTVTWNKGIEYKVGEALKLWLQCPRLVKGAQKTWLHIVLGPSPSPRQALYQPPAGGLPHASLAVPLFEQGLSQVEPPLVTWCDLGFYKVYVAPGPKDCLEFISTRSSFLEDDWGHGICGDSVLEPSSYWWEV